MSMMTENYCDECDEVVHAVFDEEDFYNHRVGTITCPKCGNVIVPCNECEDHAACSQCPWRGVQPAKAMSDEAYVRYLRSDCPKVFEMAKDGDLGEFFQKVALEIEKNEKA